MFTSAPLLAIVVAQFCFTYGQYTLMVCLPTFMKDVLKFDMKQVRRHFGFSCIQ
jgi:hypothetical protein